MAGHPAAAVTSEESAGRSGRDGGGQNPEKSVGVSPMCGEESTGASVVSQSLWMDGSSFAGVGNK